MVITDIALYATRLSKYVGRWWMISGKNVNCEPAQVSSATMQCPRRQNERKAKNVQGKGNKDGKLI